MKFGFLFKTIAVIFVFACVFSIVKMQIEINRLDAEKVEIAEQNEKLRDENDAMQNSLNEPKDDKYYEEKAREKLNLRLPEEVVFYNDLIN